MKHQLRMPCRCIACRTCRWDSSIIPIKQGDHELYVQHATQGGLLGEYFDNAYLQETPVITRVDHVVNFTWGEGRITRFGTDYVSVRWLGKVRLDVPVWCGNPVHVFVGTDNGGSASLQHRDSPCVRSLLLSCAAAVE
jgi:hypothetical protein